MGEGVVLVFRPSRMRRIPHGLAQIAGRDLKQREITRRSVDGGRVEEDFTALRITGAEYERNNGSILVRYAGQEFTFSAAEIDFLESCDGTEIYRHPGLCLGCFRVNALHDNRGQVIVCKCGRTFRPQSEPKKPSAREERAAVTFSERDGKPPYKNGQRYHRKKKR